MITSRVTPIDEPRPFEPHELFFSFTDDKGRIRYGNEVFTRVSGYDEAELVGKPHNVIRHPDMPRAVFRLLWDYLESGRTIAAYVKNLAADGRYYWVLAAVTPCRDGYLSVRLNPSSPLFGAARKAYAETLKLESALETEHGKPYAIEKSLADLEERLLDAGFPRYDDFMRAALRAELTSRAAQAPPRQAVAAARGASTSLVDLHGSLLAVGEQLGEVFRSLDLFESLSTRLNEKREAMDDLGPSLTFLALNTHISGSRLGEEGAVLSVVSRNLGERSKEADRLIGSLMERMAPACDAAEAIAFDVAIAQLEVEVCGSFVEELLQSNASESNRSVTESLASLIGELQSRCDQVLSRLHTLRDDVDVMDRAARDLVTQIDQMKAAQLNGKIDIASRRNAQGFVAIFDDVARIVGEARRDCDEVIELLASTDERLETILGIEIGLRGDLTAVDHATRAVVDSAVMVG